MSFVEFVLLKSFILFVSLVSLSFVLLVSFMSRSAVVAIAVGLQSAHTSVNPLCAATGRQG